MKQGNEVTSLKMAFVVKGTLGLATLLASLGTSITNVALPTLAGAFEASFAQVQAVVVAYLAALTVSVVLAGQMGDRFGLKPMMVGGTGLFLFATLLCSLAPTLPLLIVARALQGLGAAFMMTLSMALMRQTADPASIGRAMGLLGTMSALGTALGPTLGGLLIPAAGWRGIFWVQLPLGTIALVLAQMYLPSQTGGAVKRGPSLRSVCTWSLAGNLLVNLLVAAVMMTTLVVGPFYLSLVLGLEPTFVGLVMAVGPMLSILFGVPSGQLVDAWGSHRVIVIGLGLLGTGAFLLAFLPEMMGNIGYVASLVVLTPGYQLFQAANNTQALADVPSQHQGTTAGLLSLSRNIGLVAGATVMGGMFALRIGTGNLIHADPTAVANGMRLVFLLAAGLMVAALGIAMLRNKEG